ncbi:hypothetical protein ABE438_17635 [Bosea sp. TWI1241]|uniref:hypothetical protein n=1 Tax=Bosea sp. TWI1241 TaxID=3148904 RepID=UPI00320958DF
MTSTPDPAAAAQQNLTDFILAEVHRQTSEEALRKVVAEKIGGVVARAVDDSMRTYGGVGQKIAKAVEKALDLGEALDVPSYGHMVTAMLRAKMDEVLGQLVNEKLSAEMTEILKLAPKEVKLSEIVGRLVESEEQDADRRGESVTCIVEESSAVPGYRHIYIDPEADKRKHSCDAQIALDSDGKIYGLVIGGRDAKETIVMGRMHGWRKMIFGAYACGSKIILDEDEVVTAIGED